MPIGFDPDTFKKEKNEENIYNCLFWKNLQRKRDLYFATSIRTGEF